jgi:hypothetical protein
MANLPFGIPDARRIRSYFLRLPLATRGVLFLLVAFYIAQLINPGLDDWGALIPQEININTRTRCLRPTNPSKSTNRLSCSVQTKYLPPPPPQHPPPPPQQHNSNPAPRTLRSRTRHSGNLHPLHWSLRPVTRRPLHVVGTLHLPFQRRRHRLQRLGLPPPRQRGDETVPHEPVLPARRRADTDLDFTSGADIGYRVLDPAYEFSGACMWSGGGLSMGFGVYTVSGAA